MKTLQILTAIILLSACGTKKNLTRNQLPVENKYESESYQLQRTNSESEHHQDFKKPENRKPSKAKQKKDRVAKTLIKIDQTEVKHKSENKPVNDLKTCKELEPHISKSIDLILFSFLSSTLI